MAVVFATFTLQLEKLHRATWAGLHIVTLISRKTQCMYLFTADDIILTLKMSHNQQQGSQDPILLECVMQI